MILLLRPFYLFSQEEAENVDILAAGAAGGGVAKTKRITTRYMTKYVYNTLLALFSRSFMHLYLQNVHLLIFSSVLDMKEPECLVQEHSK